MVPSVLLHRGVEGGLNGPLPLDAALPALGVGLAVVAIVAYDAYRAYGEFVS